MKTKEFQVELVSRQRTVYTVRARDVEGARRVAMERWRRDDPADLGGFEWSELEHARAIETARSPHQTQDDELTLRFIREREGLLIRLGSTFFSATMNDAISAHQVAADLGWFTPGRGYDQPAVDVLRAAGSLERLCAMERLVCFERVRNRDGERGGIRLYCTPQYLDSLSESIPDLVVNVAR